MHRDLVAGTDRLDEPPIAVSGFAAGSLITREIPLVVAITLIALIIRIPLLSIGLWRDEAYTVFDVSPAHLSGVFARIAESESNPPLFFLIMHAWTSLVGVSEVALKMPPLIFGVLSIPAAYALGRAMGGRFVALLAAAFVTFTPELVYYSQEVRPYSLTVLLTLLAVLTYWQAIVTRRWSALAAFVVVATLLLYTQYTGIFILLGLALATAYLAIMRVSMPLGRLVLGFVAVALLFAPWLSMLIHQVHGGLPWIWVESVLRRPLKALDAFAYTVPVQFRFDNVPRKIRYLEGLIVVAVLCAAAYQLHRRLRERRPESSSYDVAMALAGVAMIIGILVEAWFSYGGGRYVLPFAALACVVYARILVDAMRAVRLTGLAARALVLVACLCVAVDLAMIFVYDRPKSGVRQIAHVVASVRGPGTVYLVAPDYIAASFAYYVRGNNMPIYGFARWDHPEIFQVDNYVALWSRPQIIPETLQRIDSLRRNGYRSLIFIRGERIGEPIEDQGSMHYGLSDKLLAALRHRYASTQQSDARGRQESATMEVFKL